MRAHAVSFKTYSERRQTSIIKTVRRRQTQQAFKESFSWLGLRCRSRSIISYRSFRWRISWDERTSFRRNGEPEIQQMVIRRPRIVKRTGLVLINLSRKLLKVKTVRRDRTLSRISTDQELTLSKRMRVIRQITTLPNSTLTWWAHLPVRFSSNNAPRTHLLGRAQVPTPGQMAQLPPCLTSPWWKALRK